MCDKMKELHVVMCGEYSDRYIVGIFSTPKKAQAQLDKMEYDVKYDYAEIEEFELDPDIDKTFYYRPKS